MCGWICWLFEFNRTNSFEDTLFYSYSLLILDLYQIDVPLPSPSLAFFSLSSFLVEDVTLGIVERLQNFSYSALFACSSEQTIVFCTGITSIIHFDRKCLQILTRKTAMVWTWVFLIEQLDNWKIMHEGN